MSVHSARLSVTVLVFHSVHSERIFLVRHLSQWLLSLVMDVVLSLDPSVMVPIGNIISDKIFELCILHEFYLGVGLLCM